MDSMVKEIIRQFEGRRCYLNGAPSRVVNDGDGMATIQPDNTAVEAVRYGWHTVNETIRRRGGFFDTRLD